MTADRARCLVTGAAGFMGSHMVEFLAEREHEVVATDISRCPPEGLPEEVRYVPADLTEPGSLDEPCRGVDIIFNPASIFDFSTPWEVIKKVNVDGAENLCRAASRAGVSRMVHWSTMMMFGDAGRREEPIVEDTLRRSNSAYAGSKILQEDLVLEYSQRGLLPATVIRPSIVYGPGSSYGFADICFKLKRLGFAPVFTRLFKRTCMVHVHDVIGAAYHLCDREDTLGQCYNITDDTALPMRDMFAFMAALLGVVPVPVPLPFSALRFLAEVLARLCSRFSRLSIDGRPLLEEDFVYLLDMDGYASNRKLRSTGYELLYPDWRSGLVRVSWWYRERGMW